MPNEVTKKVTERATIDVAEIVVVTRETTPKRYGWRTATKVDIEADIEEQEAITLIVKGTVKAKKPGRKTLTGHTITLTDALLVMEMLPLMNGGSLIYDEQDTTKIVGYSAPVVGEEITKTKFDLYVYQAIMDGSDIVGYEETLYPNCEGNPIGLNGEDDVFRVSEMEIVSAPGAGESALTMHTVAELPALTD